MKNRQAKKRREEEEDVSIPMDRLSQLPQPLLQHILSLLSQQDAVRTSVLSISWRHLWSTRPNIVFFQKGNTKRFIAALDNTFKVYHDQKLSIQELTVDMSVVESESVWLLHKWIRLVISNNKGLNKLNLSLYGDSMSYFAMPLVLFESQSLRNLSLRKCELNLNQMYSNGKVSFKHLLTLDLTQVNIVGATFETILSSCPLLETLSILRCIGLRPIKLTRAPNLKYFKLDHNYLIYGDIGFIIMEKTDVPNIRTIDILFGRFRDHNLHFPHLTRLLLDHVQMPSESFSCNFPCLEEMELSFCYGFKEFNLSSRSIIKRLVIRNMDRLFKATIDAPSIVRFYYDCVIPQSISFINTTTNPNEWKSNIRLRSQEHIDHDGLVWLDKLSEILDVGRVCDRPPAVVVEAFRLNSWGHLLSSLPDLLDRFPAYMCQYCLYVNTQFEQQKEEKKVVEFLRKFLAQQQQGDRARDLEEVRMEVWNRNGNKWQSVECYEDTRPNFLRFRLKWRGIII